MNALLLTEKALSDKEVQDPCLNQGNYSSFVLFCFFLFCFVLFRFVLFCFVLFCFALLCFVRVVRVVSYYLCRIVCI